MKKDRLSWYWHSKGIGGHGILDYLIKIEGMPFGEAVAAVSGTEPLPPRPSEPEPPKILVLPEQAEFAQARLYGYLCGNRGIDSEIVAALFDEGKLYQGKRGNVVFLGFDEQGKPRFASLRGTYGDCKFHMDCAGSDKRYCFNMAYSQSERLYIFESPIDAMSHATLEISAAGDQDSWKQQNRLALSGTADAALAMYLEMHPSIKELVFCLDNNVAGCEAAVFMARKYAAKGFRTHLELPTAKDYNKQLLSELEKLKLERSVKTAVKLHKERCL